MTTLIRFVMALAVSVIVGGVVATAANAEMPVRQRIALTIMPSEVDLNGDGITGSIALGEVKGRPGRSQYRGFAEFGPTILDDNGNPVGAGPDCPGPQVQLNLVTSDSDEPGASGNIQTFKDLSQLFTKFTSGHLCVDVTTLASTASFEGIYSGGTGRFEGASGSVTIDFTLTINVSTAPGLLPPIGIAAANGTIVGTLVLP